MRKINCLSSFILKIIALVTMAFDHVGLMLETLYPYDINVLQVADIFRIIGRLALPLFVFMIVEGVIHTKNIKKYFFRLGIMALLISIFFMVLEYSSFRNSSHGLLRAGNIFLDLLLIVLMIYLLKQNELWKKLLILLPIAFSILSFIVKGLETASGIDIHWFPCFLTLQYDWFSLLLGLGFYSSYLIADGYIKATESTTQMDKSIWEANGNYRLLVNILSIFMLVVVNFLYYCSKYYWPEGIFWSVEIELYSIISGAFILLYNGKRGYNAKWFQYGSYLYYPLHIIIIIMIFIIVNGGI